jgi:hypothetical protein
MSSNWKLPWKASCRCGQVKMTISQPPLSSWACHCRGCQKLTSGPYSLTLMLPKAGFNVDEGEPVQGGLHGPNAMMYCAHCKSWLFNSIPGVRDLVCFRATLLDDASWVVPFVDAWTEEKLPGVVSGAQRSFERSPPEAQFGGIMADFARFSARPG